MNMNRLKKLQALLTGRWRNAFLAGGLAIFLFASWTYFQMPNPRMANLTRPKLTLTASEEKTATPAQQRRAVKPGQPNPTEEKGAAGASTRQIRKTPEERREAAKKRREERLARRRQALQQRGGQEQQGGEDGELTRPTRPGRKSPVGRPLGPNRNLHGGQNGGEENIQQNEEIEPLEELGNEGEAYPSEEEPAQEEDPGAMIE